MRRRDFHQACSAARAAWPLAARAQQTAMPLFGFMAYNVRQKFVRGPLRRVPPRSQGNWFRRGTKRGGRIPLGARPLRPIPEFAAELVRRQVAVIAATGGETFAADQPRRQPKRSLSCSPLTATRSARALVASLRRPGGNITGITIFGGGTVAKRLQLMQELIPQAGPRLSYKSKPSERRNRNDSRTDGCPFFREGNACP